MLASGLSEEVIDGEDLARFITQSNHYNSTMVMPALFLPAPSSRETSVTRHGREPATVLWAIGFAAAGTRHLYGAAIFKAADVRAARLEVFASEPPSRHAAIRNWPWDARDPVLQKALQKELAILIASAAGKPVLR